MIIRFLCYSTRLLGILFAYYVSLLAVIVGFDNYHVSGIRVCSIICACLHKVCVVAVWCILQYIYIALDVFRYFSHPAGLGYSFVIT